MSITKVDELKCDVEELRKLVNAATRPKVKEILSLEVRKLETEVGKLEKQLNLTNQHTSTIPAKNPDTGNKRSYDVKLFNYAWDQSDKYVKLFVTLENVHSHDSELITCTFSERLVELRVNEFNNKNFILTIKNLSANIDPSKSHWKVKTDMVVVFLCKSKPDHWSNITESEQKSKDSNKKDVEDVDSSGDPSQGLINLMKKMYDEGDDEMKRTIAKAWCEGREKGVNTLD